LKLELLTTANEQELQPFRTPALKVCKKVPAGALGLFSESHCLTNVRSGSFSWATPSNGGTQTWYCLLQTSGANGYSDNLCQTPSPVGAFEAKLYVEAFPKLLGTGGLATLKGEVIATKTELDCKTDTFSGRPETGSLTGKAKIEYKECTIGKPAKCEVRSVGQPGLGTIITKELNGSLLSDSLADFTPASGSIFVELEIVGSGCTIASTTPQKVEGAQMCTFLAGIETPAEEHELKCLPSESALKFALKAATYEGSVLIHLEGKPLWKIK
jgi:hypothetical protein